MPKLSEVAGTPLKLSQVTQPESFNAADGMSRFDQVAVGAGRGLTALGQGGKQAILNIGAALGLVDPKTAEDYNNAVAQEAAQYERDLGNSNWAKVGEIGSQVLATLPLGAIGGVGAGATGAARLGAPARAGAI